jgi:DNA modification methylase
VAFSKGKSTVGWIMDMIYSGGTEKESHEWQKTLIDLEYLIEEVTDPGALVVDPFAGVRTVPAACRNLRRRW